jgi:hypothetical protein
MMTRQIPGIVAFSDRLYRLLMWLYPADHRREYGPLMAQVFRDQCRTAYLRDGASGVLWVWFPLVVDLAVSLTEEHRRKGFSMSKESFARFSSPLLMLGGLAWVLSSYSQFQPGSHYNYWGIYQLSIAMISPAFLLTGAGVIGIQVRYRAQLGRVGQVALVAAVLGSALAAISILLMTFVNDKWWNGAMVGFMLQSASLLIFGIASLRSTVMGIRSGLLLVIGIIGLLPMTRLIEAETGGFTWRTFIIMLVMGLSWIAFGFSIRAERPQTQAVGA